MRVSSKVHGAVVPIMLILAVALPPTSVGAQSSNIEVSMERLRRLLHIPRVSVAKRHGREVPFASLIRKVARANGIEPALLAALVRVESNFDPRAVSHAGARGLGQLMPATGRELGVTNPFNPQQNLRASARYLAEQIRAFGTVPLALAAYNAGPARVERGTVPTSTRQYIVRIERIADDYRQRGMP